MDSDFLSLDLIAGEVHNLDDRATKIGFQQS